MTAKDSQAVSRPGARWRAVGAILFFVVGPACLVYVQTEMALTGRPFVDFFVVPLGSMIAVWLLALLFIEHGNAKRMGVGPW